MDLSTEPTGEGENDNDIGIAHISMKARQSCPWLRVQLRLRMSSLAARRLSPVSTGACIVNWSRQKGDLIGDEHPCVIKYCQPDSAMLGREGDITLFLACTVNNIYTCRQLWG